MRRNCMREPVRIAPPRRGRPRHRAGLGSESPGHCAFLSTPLQTYVCHFFPSVVGVKPHRPLSVLRSSGFWEHAKVCHMLSSTSGRRGFDVDGTLATTVAAVKVEGTSRWLPTYIIPLRSNRNTWRACTGSLRAIDWICVPICSRLQRLPALVSHGKNFEAEQHDWHRGYLYIVPVPSSDIPRTSSARLCRADSLSDGRSERQHVEYWVKQEEDAVLLNVLP